MTANFSSGGRPRAYRAERQNAEEYYERERYPPRYPRERDTYRARRTDYHDDYEYERRAGRGGGPPPDPRDHAAPPPDLYERDAYGHDYTRDGRDYREERAPRRDRDPRDRPDPDDYRSERRALNAV